MNVGIWATLFGPCDHPAGHIGYRRQIAHQPDPARPQHLRHDYDLMKQTRLLSGTLYPLLMRMTDRGLSRPSGARRNSLAARRATLIVSRLRGSRSRGRRAPPVPPRRHNGLGMTAAVSRAVLPLAGRCLGTDRQEGSRPPRKLRLDTLPRPNRIEFPDPAAPPASAQGDAYAIGAFKQRGLS